MIFKAIEGGGGGRERKTSVDREGKEYFYFSRRKHTVSHS
jgi:hypothetical protein